MKTALITGISGQDGSLLAEFLLEKNYKVYGLLREKSSKENLINIINHKNLQLIYGDLLNNDLIHFLLKYYQFDEIYNLASQSNIRLSYENPLNTFNVTLIGTLILLDNIKKYSPTSKMFQAGSSAMFGNSIDEDGFQRETTLFKPINPYASSKLFAYNISNNYRENENLYIVNGIMYNHESPKSKTLLGVTNTIVKNAFEIKKGQISEYYIPNLKIHLDIGHARDYINAMWLTMQQEVSSNYIISFGKTHTIEYICKYVFTKIGLDYKQYIKTESVSPNLSEFKGDASRLKTLGWIPQYTFEDTMDEIIEHYNNIK